MNFRRANQDTHQNLSYNNKSFQMVTLNRPQINPPVRFDNMVPPHSGNMAPPHAVNLAPPHSGNLGPPMVNRSNSSSSYVKMNPAAVNKEILYEKAGRIESLYDEVGPLQWSNEYSEPGKERTNADN